MILAAIWQRIIPFNNIAWRVNLMCALVGALAVGLMALLISKSGRVMASRCGFLQGRETGAGRNWIILASSVSAAWMLAFSPVMWSQSVVTEVGTLNVFFLVAILALLYRWSFEPERRWRIYLAGFLWGVSLTDHQTLVLLTVAFPTFLWFVNRKLGRDVLAPILAVIVLAVVKMIRVTRQLVLAGGVRSGLGLGAWSRCRRVAALLVETGSRADGNVAMGARDLCRCNSRDGSVRLCPPVYPRPTRRSAGVTGTA